MITLRAVPGISAEMVLAVDREWLKTRLFRSHEQTELVGAIADTRAMFEGRVGLSLRHRLTERERADLSRKGEIKRLADHVAAFERRLQAAEASASPATHARCTKRSVKSGCRSTTSQASWWEEG